MIPVFTELSSRIKLCHLEIKRLQMQVADYSYLVYGFNKQIEEEFKKIQVYEKELKELEKLPFD